VHEFYHATKHRSALSGSQGLSSVDHQEAFKAESNAIKEFGKKNKEKK
jgi:hypothetical protein